MWSRGRGAYIPLQASVLIPYTCTPGEEHVPPSPAAAAVAQTQAQTQDTDLRQLERLLVLEGLAVAAVPLHVYK
jgi:hypothetical protein